MSIIEGIGSAPSDEHSGDIGVVIRRCEAAVRADGISGLDLGPGGKRDRDPGLGHPTLRRRAAPRSDRWVARSRAVLDRRGDLVLSTVSARVSSGGVVSRRDGSSTSAPPATSRRTVST